MNRSPFATPRGRQNLGTDNRDLSQRVRALEQRLASEIPIDAIAGLTAQDVQAALEQLNWVAAPATAASPGTAGSMAYDASFLYVCVATDTWVRVGLATW